MNRQAWRRVLAFGVLIGVAGCGDDDRPRPVTAGSLKNVTVWTRPVQRPGELGENSGSSYKDGRVDVYENFIVVTPDKQDSMLVLHGWYTDLRFKKD